MKKRTLRDLGVPPGLVGVAHPAAAAALKGGMSKQELKMELTAVLESPEAFVDHEHWGEMAAKLSVLIDARKAYIPRKESAPWRKWGENLEETSIQQMRNACELPISVQGALMPDAHLGYGLPIGGVLATKGAVIPYAVGVDIACRVKMTVLDLPVDRLKSDAETLKSALIRETQFGIGARFKKRRQHDVIDADWSVSPITEKNKDRAWSQLGSSGSGNHFVEYGEFTVDHEGIGVPPGAYLAILSHSGSRGTGADVCKHYSKRAMEQHIDLPEHLRHLAWLDLDSEEGQEYWAAMNLMGEYASANHECIHRHMKEVLGAEVLVDIENHHNFAWKEEHFGEEVIVHRKGATPAGEGALGIIPGSMATPTYVVRGLGHPESMNSAAHGAGRVMSRTKAIRTLSRKDWMELMKKKGITLLSAGLDEAPMVYKNINDVMRHQADLVEPIAQFHPKMVRMAKGGRAED
jgi:tRNA-splicing ligase RtcB